MAENSNQPLTRVSMTLSEELLHKLDAMIAARGLPSRSKLIAELIEDAIADIEDTPDAILAGTITLIYRAGFGWVRHRIAETQRIYLKEVISSQHVFLENEQSLEVLLVQGPLFRLNALCDELRALRGVQQVRLVKTTALLPPLHDHSSEKGENNE